MIEKVEIHFDDVLLLSLYRLILLWSMRTRNVVSNILSLKVSMEALELSPLVKLESYDLGVELSFDVGLKFYTNL